MDEVNEIMNKHRTELGELKKATIDKEEEACSVLELDEKEKEEDVEKN